jgi:hypothetical protein
VPIVNVTAVNAADKSTISVPFTKSVIVSAFTANVSTTTRADINALKEKPQANPRIVVELITEEYITAELIAELTAALSNTSWSFVIK